MRAILLGFLFLLGGMISVQAASVCVKEICVDVTVAQTDEELERGLQGKKNLAEYEGMLFIFDSDDFQRFWMKDMAFAIDMIWIDSQKHIVTIASSRLPCVENPCETYAPTDKARYVWELPSGFAVKHQLAVGDRVEFKGID